MSTRHGQIGDESGIRPELAVIPRWAIVLAAIIFISIPVFFLTVVWPGGGAQEAPFFRIAVPLIPATFLATLMLMIGYVNRDAGRRGMNRTVWTLVVIFVPNAIGFILYFLLRNPLRMQCPQCAAVVDPRVNYCPQCRYGFRATCPQCKSAVRHGDTFCAHCGMQLEIGK